MSPRLPFVFLLACAGAAPRVDTPAPSLPPDPATWHGTLSFDTRHPTPRGASAALTPKPARLITVRLVDDAGVTVAESQTDREGAFQIRGDRNVARQLVVLSRVRHDGHAIDVTRDAAGLHPHALFVPLPEDTEAALALHATDAIPMAGALHILDTLLLGVETVRAWVDETLPPFFAYWDRGVTTNWSFYVGQRGELVCPGERPAGGLGPNDEGPTEACEPRALGAEAPEGASRLPRYGIELLGGEPGRQADTDTDEHDEMIVMHELGHFVMDVLSSDSSHGGSHPRGVLIDPGLAWEEGRATWFATAVLGSPRYQDTIGLEPRGSLRVDHDVERGEPGDVRGMGSESSVAEILWDLADGADGLPDRDGDPIALGPARVLRAMMELGQRPGSYPALPTFLQYLVKTEIVQASTLVELLRRNREPLALLPEGDHVPWPRSLDVPGTVAAKIDGLSDPAPSGGPARASNGIDAVHAYRVHVAEPGWLAATLTIFGTGRQADRHDLDLELRDLRSDLLDRSAGEEPTESVGRAVEPGWYILYVRDGGGGNRVGYELKVERR